MLWLNSHNFRDIREKLPVRLECILLIVVRLYRICISIGCRSPVAYLLFSNEGRVNIKVPCTTCICEHPGNFYYNSLKN